MVWLGIAEFKLARSEKEKKENENE